MEALNDIAEEVFQALEASDFETAEFYVDHLRSCIAAFPSVDTQQGMVTPSSKRSLSLSIKTGQWSDLMQNWNDFALFLQGLVLFEQRKYALTFKLLQQVVFNSILNKNSVSEVSKFLHGERNINVNLRIIYHFAYSSYAFLELLLQLIITFQSLHISKFQEGLSALQAFLRLNQHLSCRLTAEAYLVQAKLYLKLGMREKAVHSLHQSLDIYPKLWASFKLLSELNDSFRSNFGETHKKAGVSALQSAKLPFGQKDQLMTKSDPEQEAFQIISQDFSLVEFSQNLLSQKGMAYKLFLDYECDKALDILKCMDSSYSSVSCWLQMLKGRCYFEKSDYKKAIESFEYSRRIQPSMMQGLEFYSTALWHLKKESELSFLSQEILNLDKFSPQTWIVLGNCFSLHRDHDSALKFFNRAIQVDPNCSYAYTLSAHEYVSNEDYEKAISLYRQALKHDSRHYTAWYGLGNVYLRQEKYSMAIFHFRKAIAINSKSSVLRCYLGMALHANGDLVDAFNEYEVAASLNPHNLVVKFQKAKLYVETGVTDNGLELLKEILQIAPREAAVHYEIGMLFKKLNQPDLSLKHLSIAKDLDPKIIRRTTSD